MSYIQIPQHFVHFNTLNKFLYLILIGYHLSVTKLNGLSTNFHLKYQQQKSFFHHQIQYIFTK
jgi:hypothetical protein